MLRNANLNANPVIVAAVEQLLEEDRQFERSERRVSFRESISRPVTIKVRDQVTEYPGFSKNISFEGIGLISQKDFAANLEAKIEIHSSQDKNPIVLCRLAWCRPFGEGWYVSGWHFVTVVRS